MQPSRAVTASVSILCHTLSGNAFGRAWVLAELLREDFAVHIVTACRPSDELWLPARGVCDFEIRRWRSFSYPGFLLRAPSIARRIVTGDLLVSVKPRLSSLGLALAAKKVRARPLIADIDDNELGFSSLARDVLGAPWALLSAASALHTRHHSALSHRADAITVSNSFLYARHGGMWLPHARDARLFSPGVPPNAEPPTIMFVGTPRAHKGLHDLLAAFRRITLPARLRIVGGANDPALVASAADDPRISVEPPVPMSELPALLGSADIVCIPQQDGPASQGQLPAKLLDAMAMGRAIVSTRVGDIPRWLADDAGVVVAPGDVSALSHALSDLVADPVRRTKLAERARERFSTYGSIEAVRPRFVALAKRLLAGEGAGAPWPAFASAPLSD